MDIRATQAREHHEALTRHRAARDHLIRQLRQENPQYWTYRRLARVLDCSHQLIAYIVGKQDQQG